MPSNIEAGIAQTLAVAEAAAAAPFPELAAAPPEQRQAILAHIGRTNPQRFQEIKAHIAQVKELAGNQIAEAQRIHQYQEAQKQQQQEQAKHSSGNMPSFTTAEFLPCPISPMFSARSWRWPRSTGLDSRS